jgi:hypothetical protein
MSQIGVFSHSDGHLFCGRQALETYMSGIQSSAKFLMHEFFLVNFLGGFWCSAVHMVSLGEESLTCAIRNL